MRQVIDRGVPLIADPARLADVAAVGVDETGFLRGNATRPDELRPGSPT